MKQIEWSRQVLRPLTLIVCLSCAAAQDPKTLKVWTFTPPHGTLEIEVRVHPNGTSNMSIRPDQSGREAPIAEQVGPLKQVLAEMQSLGVDPQGLTYIGKQVYGQGQDVAEKLAYACADSKECRMSTRTPEEERARLLVAVLNQSGVFEPYNEAFEKYGIRVHVTAAEKIVLVRLSSVPPRNSRDRANGRMLVLGGGYVGMRFSRIDADKKDKK